MSARSNLSKKIWWRGRQWAVTAYGIECLDGTYAIDAKRLGMMRTPSQAEWPAHMAEKEWVDMEDFMRAFSIALIRHKVKSHNVVVATAFENPVTISADRLR